MYKERHRLMMALVLAVVFVSLQLFAGDEPKPTEFEEGKLFIELNNTDGDLGIHGKLDGGPWTRAEFLDVDGNRMFHLVPKRGIRKQGLTEIFFESAEPTFDETSPEAFFSRFPEGTYFIEGTLKGADLVNEIEFTHLLPAPPGGIMINDTAYDPDVVDCDEGPIPAVEEPIVISWDPVTTSHPELGRTGEAVVIDRYQVVVEREETDEKDFVRILSIDLPPDATEMDIPEMFIALGEEFKFEVLAREESGNQTAVEGCFELK
jgi:hypothetical protein